MKITTSILKIKLLEEKLESYLEKKDYYNLSNLICDNLKLFRKIENYHEKNLYLIISLIRLIVDELDVQYRSHYHHYNIPKITRTLCTEIVFSNLFRDTEIDVIINLKINRHFLTHHPISTLEKFLVFIVHITSKQKRAVRFNSFIDFLSDPTFGDIQVELIYNLVEGYSKEIRSYKELKDKFDKFKKDLNYQQILKRYEETMEKTKS